ncbi:MAG: DUF1684 domain-containing protein [Rhizomicrobium sp.]|nr:DUF1684 domain-containing protein [Rhizomicrobium sp.]
MWKYLAVAALLLTSAEAKSPAEEWKASLAADNAAWATAKHAILKINDAAYVHEGEFVSLLGDKPATWHWAKGKQPKAALIAGFAHGKPQLFKNGKALPPEALSKGIDIAAGVDVLGAPTQMSPGETGLRIMVYDQGNKAAVAFKGVDYFAYDPAYRVSARFTPDAKMTPHVFRTSRGLDKQFYHAGDAVFTLQGKTITLPLYGEEKNPTKVTDMTSFFTDQLTGKGAYRAGRYVDVEKFGKFPPTSVSIDFNYAYNPNCARSIYYNCPFAVDFIPLAIKAGEKDPHTVH